MDGKRVLLAAHRGDQKCCPENTMPAFEAALKAGVDMIETDIHMTRDGELVLIHDRSAKRTCGVDVIINDMTLEEVRKLDAGACFSEKFKETPVPTVREFMEWVSKTDLLVNWELKDYPKDVGVRAFACAERLLEMIQEFGLEKRSMLNSFSDQVLEYFWNRSDCKMPIHGQGIHQCKHTVDEASVPEEDMFDWCCMYPEKDWTLAVDGRENFDYCTERGIHPCICIADTMENYKKALDFGCKMFTSNDIYTADEILRELGVRG